MTADLTTNGSQFDQPASREALTFFVNLMNDDGPERYATNRLFVHPWRLFGADPLAWLSDALTGSAVLVIASRWLLFASRMRLTPIQSRLDSGELDP